MEWIITQELDSAAWVATPASGVATLERVDSITIEIEFDFFGQFSRNRRNVHFFVDRFDEWRYWLVKMWIKKKMKSTSDALWSILTKF